MKLFVLYYVHDLLIIRTVRDFGHSKFNPSKSRYFIRKCKMLTAKSKKKLIAKISERTINLI